MRFSCSPGKYVGQDSISYILLQGLYSIPVQHFAIFYTHSNKDATQQNHYFSPKDKCQVPHPQQDARCFCPPCISANPQNTCFVTHRKCRAAKQEVAVREHRKPSGALPLPITIHPAGPNICMVCLPNSDRVRCLHEPRCRQHRCCHLF